MEINRENLAWAGGLFEGEGCFFGTTKNKRRALIASLRMTDEDSVRKFHQFVGVGTVSGPLNHKSGNPKWKPFWDWSVTFFENFQFVVCLLWKHLGIRRRAKAKELLNNYLAMPCEFRYAPKKQCKLTQEKVNQIKALRGLESQTKIAKNFGTHQSIISLIFSGKRWAR